ncbi:MAG: hypothetical protein FWD88_05620 [Treponema sp.]|nr:hypothetical protein [Treponema sp.]
MTRKLLLGMMVAVMALGMAFAGCAGEDSALSGTWDSRDEPGMAWRFRNGNVYVLFHDELVARGTYTARDGRIVLTYTHAYCCCLEFMIGEEIAWSYSVSGDTLQLEGEIPATFTRRR